MSNRGSSLQISLRERECCVSIYIIWKVYILEKTYQNMDVRLLKMGEGADGMAQILSIGELI